MDHLTGVTDAVFRLAKRGTSRLVLQAQPTSQAWFFNSETRAQDPKKGELGFVFSFWTKYRCQSLTEQLIKYHLIPQAFQQPILCSLAARRGGLREAAPMPSLFFIGQRFHKESLLKNNFLLLNIFCFPPLHFNEMLKILEKWPFIYEAFLYLITYTGKLYRTDKQQENSFFFSSFLHPAGKI